jgi:hypothetical protein
MVFHYLRHAALAATLLHQTIAQQSNIVPEDLRGGFTSQGIEMQASYTGEAVNGFRDGTSFDKNGKPNFIHRKNNKDLHALAVSQEPTFALGDSSGISPTTLHTIIMVDTTCPDKRVLHYARANFKNNFVITNIDTKSEALQKYKAPGSFGETGDNRQYSFLMYINPQRKEIDSLRLPAEGEAFDVQKFQTDNGLQDPFAGVGMVVKLGGQANCGGEQPNEVPDNLSSARPPPSSTAAARPTSQPAATSSTARVQPTTTSARQPVSSAANASPSPSFPSSPNNPGNDNNNPPAVSSNRPNGPVPSAGPNAPSQPAGPTSGQVAPSNVAPTDGLATSTVAAGPNVPVGASGTSSPSPAEQTTNAAPGMSMSKLGPLASLFAIAGLLVW